MDLINVNKIFENAIYENKIEVIENMLSSSDNKVDLVEQFTQSNDLEKLSLLLPKFRSKGLVRDLENICDMIANNPTSNSVETLKTSKIVLIHKENKKENIKKHLEEKSFEVRTLSSY